MHKDNNNNENFSQAGSEKNLLISILLNGGITVGEIIGGLLSNSLALLSDALHNLGDTLALLLAYIAGKISRRKNTSSKTFGYKRVEILAALLNAIVLVVIVVYLFVEACHRMLDPQPVKGVIMFFVAFAGLIANLASVLLLKKHARQNINVRAAYLHLIGDTVSSVLVVITAALIAFFNIYWIDPLVTFFLGIYLLKETWSIMKESVDILMQGTPAGLDLAAVKKSLESLPEIDNVHHIHAWNLNDREIHFECHAELKNDIKLSETRAIHDQIEAILFKQFNIPHVTIQYGYKCCEDKSMIHFS